MSVNEREGRVPRSFSRREEPSVGELVRQHRCEHRWLNISTALLSGGFEFRRCAHCGKNAWIGPDGPVDLAEVLDALARDPGRGRWHRRP